MFHCLVHDNFMPLLANDPARKLEVRSFLLPFICVLESISILQNRKYEKRVHQQIRAFLYCQAALRGFPSEGSCRTCRCYTVVNIAVTIATTYGLYFAAR